jgi:hypothetical protein
LTSSISLLYTSLLGSRLSLQGTSKRGWAATGLFSFNSERGLRHTPKPPELTVLKEMVASHDKVLQTATTAVAHVTPVTIEVLILLHDLIKQDNCALNDHASKARIQRYVKKFISAAQISFAKQIPLQD